MKKILFLILTFMVVNNVPIGAQTKSRSAKTGRYVTKQYATKHKSTTYTSSTKSRKSKK